MTKTSRKILFWSLVLIFLIISPIIALYAIGYRYNFQTGKITEAGGIFLRANQNSAKIFVNGKFKKETGFFGGSALLDSLSPKTYSIKIEKDSFLPWEKKLTVNPKFVTEARNIILIPENPKINKIVGQNISDFLFSKNNRLIALKISANTQENSKAKIGVFNLENNSLSLTELPEKSLDFELNKWSEDGNSLLINMKERNTTKWFILKKSESEYELFEIFKKAFMSSLKNILPPFESRSPEFNPQNSSELFFLDDNDLRIFNYDTGILSKAIFTEINSFKIANGRIYALRNNNLIYKADLDGTNETALFNNPINSDFKKDIIVKIIISDQDNIALIGSSNNFYLYENEKNNFYQIDNAVENVEFSKDGTKIIYKAGEQIICFYLKDIYTQPFKNAGEKELIINNMSETSAMSWYHDDYHLFYFDEGRIKFTDLDGRDKRNINDLTLANGERIHFDIKTKKFYYLNNSELYSINIE